MTANAIVDSWHCSQSDSVESVYQTGLKNKMKVSFLLIFVFLTAANNASAVEDLESLMSASLAKLAEVKNEEGGAKQDLFFVPLHFDIEMKFNLGNSLVENNNVAQSNVRIFGKNQANGKCLSLHASGLDFNTSSIQVKSDGKRLAVKEIDYEYNDFYSRVFIYFETEIETQTALEIYLEYKTDIKKLLSVNMGSNTTELLVNYIQNSYHNLSSNCNYMFPCFGNELKSTFNLTLIHDKEYTSLSNGNLVSNSADSKLEEWATDKYSWTTEIQPELLTFVIFSNNFSYVEGVFGTEKKPVRVYAPKDDIHKEIFKYTANVTSTILTFYEEYFETSTRVPRIHLFFVPEQFILFESLGINVYGYSTEDGINLIPTSDSESTNAYMVQHITQGIAKQWVGQWWDPKGELVLSDIYPRYISYLGLEAISSSLSDLAVYTDFLEIETLGRLTAKSELETSNKGALLIRSFEGVLTRGGVRRVAKFFLKDRWDVADEADYFYLSEMVVGNYTWADMFNVLVRFMNNDGLPVVKASIANRTHFAFRQEPFRKPDKDIKNVDDESSLWIIPLSHIENHQNSQPQIAWLKPHENVTFAAGSTKECILVNPDATGYHRTLYDDPILFNRIQNLLVQNHEAIQPLTRARLLADYFAFAEQDYCTYSMALNLTTYMSRETNLVVWTAFLDKFTKVYSRFLSHPDFPKLQHYLLPKIDLLLTQTEELSAESIDLELFRAKLLLVGCRYQIEYVGEINTPYCLKLSRNLFHSWRNSPDGASPLNSIFPQTLRPIFECSIVATGGKEAFDFLFKKYQEQKSNNESYYGILSSLACVQETSVIEQLLHKTLQPISSDGFGSWDSWYVINFMIDTPMPNGRAQILPFISSNFDQVVEKIGDGYSKIIPKFLRHLANYLSTTKQKQEIEKFVSIHQDKIINTTDTVSHLNEAFAAMDSNIQWMDAYSQDILNWLDNHST